LSLVEMGGIELTSITLSNEGLSKITK